MRYIKLTVIAVIAVAAMVASSAAYGAPRAAATTAPTAVTAGQITVVTPFVAGPRSPVLVTGAIGDHGTLVSTNRDGAPDANGNYGKLVLAHGSFLVDARALINSIRSTAPPNKATCTVTIAGTGAVPVLDGTGAYRGIHGTLHGTARAGVLGPRNAKGQCSSHAAPIDILGLITVSGRVAY